MANLGILGIAANGCRDAGEALLARVGVEGDFAAGDGELDTVAGHIPPDATGLAVEPGVGPGGGEVEALFVGGEVAEVGASLEDFEGLAGGPSGRSAMKLKIRSAPDTSIRGVMSTSTTARNS